MYNYNYFYFNHKNRFLQPNPAGFSFFLN